MKHNFDHLPKIFEKYPSEPASLIPILQDIQKEYRYLPCEALKETAVVLDLPLSKVFSVSTFYNSFSLDPKGEKIIRICMGTTCHIRGGKLIQDQLENQLKIKAGKTTKDLKFTLEIVNCVGACALAPVVIVNEKYHASVKVSQSKKLLKG